jgi:hypothetical protein
MLHMKEEYLAAGLRKQITLLEQLLEDIDRQAGTQQGVTAKIRRVESELQRLRSELIALMQD